MTTPVPFDYSITGWQSVAVSAPAKAGFALRARWRTIPSDTTDSTNFTVPQLLFDLTPLYGEQIVQGSVRFKLGGRTYVDRAGTLYHSVNPATGAGVAGGSINYASGAATVTDWAVNANNTLVLESLATEIGLDYVSSAVFRTPIVPVRPSSLQLRFLPVQEAAEVQVSADAQGRFSNLHCSGVIDYQSGLVRVRFGRELQITPANRATVEAKPWYNVAFEYTRAGNTYIFEPRPIYANSLRYNAIGYTYLPLSADILGLDPVRLPADGRVPIFRAGDVVVVHSTRKNDFSVSPAPGAVHSTGRTRASYIKVYDQNNFPMPESMRDIDLDAGTVTLTSSYSGVGRALPWIVEDRVEDEAIATDVQISGRVALGRTLTHDFDSADTYVSSALVFGDLQARVYGLFEQGSWASEWSDSPEGSAISASFNDAAYPITTKNRGAVEERWAIIFTGSNSFRVVGEHVGQIATGSTALDCSPGNPSFPGSSYFTIPALGWGGGWASGNVLRFNTAACSAPVWAARTVLQGPETAQADSFQVQVRGDVDRE